MIDRPSLSPAIAPPTKPRAPIIAWTIVGVGVVFAGLTLIARPIWRTETGVVEADLGNVVLHIPRDEEFTQVFLSDRDATGLKRPPSSVSFDICDQRKAKRSDAGCRIHGVNGTWVRLQRADVGSEFSILAERPLGLGRPPEVELVPKSLEGRMSADFDSPLAAEQSALSRVRTQIWGDEPQLATTDHAWPIADCDLHPAGRVGCRFGFLVEGTPVVAQWFSPTSQKAVTQTQVWDVATDIDRRLHKLVVNPARQRS